jgi:hypothetical protein
MVSESAWGGIPTGRREFHCCRRVLRDCPRVIRPLCTPSLERAQSSLEPDGTNPARFLSNPLSKPFTFKKPPLEAAMKSARRNFLRTIPIVLAVAAASPSSELLAQAKPAAAGPKLEESDPQAKALGYVHDATKADKAKFANWKPGETCDGCGQFKGKPKDAFGPCTIFGNKQVAGKGWCTAWQKKT